MMDMHKTSLIRMMKKTRNMVHSNRKLTMRTHMHTHMQVSSLEEDEDGLGKLI